MGTKVFISYSSKDSKFARAICSALESRGLSCWISSRDVGLGENFMDAIVNAISAAKVMVLVFSENANNSDDIKREIVLASSGKVTIIPVRVEDVVPKGAFAYQLATRQWIDLFEDWEAQIERLVTWIAGIAPATPKAQPNADQANAERLAQEEKDRIRAAEGARLAEEETQRKKDEAEAQRIAEDNRRQQAEAERIAEEQGQQQAKPPPNKSEDRTREVAWWGVLPLAESAASVCKPVEVSFTVAAQSADVRNEIVRALAAQGGCITVDDGFEIRARFGSKPKLFKLGGPRLAAIALLGGPKKVLPWLPRVITVQMEDNSRQIRVSIVVRFEDDKIILPAFVAEEVQKRMHDDANSLKKLFPTANG